MASSSGKDDFQRFGLGEVLAVLAPGAILVLANLVWISSDAWPRLFEGHELSLFITSAFVLLSYAVGLVLNAWAVQGWLLYVGLVEQRPTLGMVGKLASGVLLPFLWFFHGWRYNLQHGRDVETRTEMYRYIRKKCGETVSLDIRLFDFFHFFRTICWDSLENGEARILLEADFLFRRRLFCHVVSLAFLVAGVEIGARLVTRLAQNHWTWSVYDIVIASLTGAGILASLLLRAVAFRLLRDEATYTYALFHEAIQPTP